ncbi:Protein GFS12 [Vitis vinifera]|uniref:Protein GFS12 n=1 Tax=Vitis vinifera TaxID=29760 RepID=A0A438F7I4_VITVI|nr:Protein GFS12 [Vitis vinifera]
MEDEPCFECLQRRFQSDFSNKLIFSYGVSDSGLPFGSGAVVQMADPNGEAASAEFILVCMPTHANDCLAKYVDEYFMENPEGSYKEGIGDIIVSEINQHQAEVGVPNLTDETASSDSLLNRSESLLNGDRKIIPAGLMSRSSKCNHSKLASDFSSGSVEDHVLCSLSLLIEGKATGRDSINFLNLVGIPSFNEDIFPGCLRHPNIAPILGMLKTSDYLLSALAYIHGLGVTHGNICPSNVMLTDSCCLGCAFVITHGCPSQDLYADLKLSPSIDWHLNLNRWWRGDLSNFEYLLILNRLAGRRWGDHTFHTVMPWVIDFSIKPDENVDEGWRDLSKSKWRLAKGDEQLDFTYSTSEIPHHVSDECLSELAVCSYKARRLPLSVLRLAVRSVYEPNEYPSNMQRLYQWTPDECIPEFYCDPQIFRSLHSGMADLAVPSWARSPEEFIKVHRDALESDRVSCQIHHWIDITFGYKMSGQAALAAMNVMLPSTEPMMPRSVGRRQLFTQPHPTRRCATWKTGNSTNKLAVHQCQGSELVGEKPLLPQTVYLQDLEEAAAFSEHAWHLSPLYCYHPKNLADDVSSVEEPPSESSKKGISKTPELGNKNGVPSEIDLNYLLDYIEVDDEGSVGYQELLLWRQKSYCSRALSEDVAKDIFSVGCILAELHLRRPLFDSTSLAMYLENGILPGLIQELPPHTKALVEACILKDWRRRPSAKSLLESPYFLTTVRSSYLFVAPLQLLAKDGSRLRYAANFAKQGALKAMGAFGAEMCAPYCLPLVVAPLSDTEAEWAYILLKEFLKCLKSKASFQATGYSHLKVSLLQDSFVREVWNRVGKQTYLEMVHPLVISNLFVAPHKSSASAASVLLIGSSEELGVPITVHQTILPLIHCFGKGLCTDGIDVLVRIGGLFGENFIARHILPLLKNVVRYCIDVSSMNKPEPMQSWSALALIDCLMAFEGLVTVLPKEAVVKELTEDQSFVHVMVLMQANLEIPVLQGHEEYEMTQESALSGSRFSSLRQRPFVGQVFICILILLWVQVLLVLLPCGIKNAFAKEYMNKCGKLSFLRCSLMCRNASFIALPCLVLQVLLEDNFESVAANYLIALCQRIGPDLTAFHVLPKLKELFDELAFSQETANGSGSLGRALKFSKSKVDEEAQMGSRMDLVLLLYPSFASLLGIEKLRQCCATWLLLEQYLLRCHNWKWEHTGESSRTGAENISANRPIFSKGSVSEYNPAKLLLNGDPVQRHAASSSIGKREPWFWFPSPAASWDGPDFLGRVGGLKDELPWKIRASVIHSARAHHGALRSLAVCQDECTVFTAGVGPGFKGTIQRWELTGIDCVSGYYGHEEVVNDICILSSSGRVASCDGTIHIWNSQTGKLIKVFSEPSADSLHLASPLSSASKINNDQANMLNPNSLTSGILTSAFDGSLYTCMHLLESVEKLVVGTGNGSLRFIDVVQGQKLHLWRSESIDSGFPSFVSAVCSCGSDRMQVDGASALPSWIAAGFSSGSCRLLDARSGNLIASWRAHDGYITKLAAREDHLLVSSSLDRTLRIWDLRRGWSAEPIIFRGHTDGVSGFSVWGQDIISISKNKIGLSSLSRSADEEGQHWVTPQKLYMPDRGTRHLSVLSSISILPFSRLFLVGTEDGYLRICC